MPKKFEIKRTAPIENDAAPFVPVKDAPTAMNAVLTVVMQHTSDVFQNILTAISEHYKIDREEMLNVIVNHPAYKNIEKHDVIRDMGYLPSPEEEPPVVKKKFKVKKPAADT